MVENCTESAPSPSTFDPRGGVEKQRRIVLINPSRCLIFKYLCGGCSYDSAFLPRQLLIDN